MIWHIITRIGPKDAFVPKLTAEDPRIEVAIDQPGNNNQVVHHLLDELYKRALIPSIGALDLLNLAVAAYTADLRVPRTFAEDRWQREFCLYLPVRNLDGWNALKAQLSSLLSFLTGDLWSLEFRTIGEQPAPTLGKALLAQPSRVCLFSGGLDSFTGALDILSLTSDHVALVGHYGSGSTHGEQKRVYEVINAAYPNRTNPFWFFVQPRKLDKRQAEDTMRSRSIIFLALGTAVASTLSAEPITLSVPENGLISLNIPLTDARAGSLSTRTTHPHVVNLFQRVLDALSLSVRIETPFKFSTKGEILVNGTDQNTLRASARTTMSCSRPSAGRYQRLSPGKHCGYCVPCIIRRAAMKAAGLDDAADYSVDLLKDKSKANEPRGRDRRAFEMAIERLLGMADLEVAAEVAGTGPMQPTDLPSLVQVYKRGLAEVANFLQS
jgi:7-cyano-7-deazaguanine synthase in queuosine biosynthesis